MKPITLETTVGELIPEGNYCKKVDARCLLDVGGYCEFKKDFMNYARYGCILKNPNCPKPPIGGK